MLEMFTWCRRCVFYYQCYEFDETGIVGGPNFLEPSCGDGPATKAEIIPADPQEGKDG